MAETKSNTRGFLTTPTGGNYFWIKSDAVADTFSVVVGTPNQYQNDTGTTAFQITNATTLKSKTVIPPENQGNTFNQSQIETSGGSDFLEKSISQGMLAISDQRTDITLASEGGDTELPDVQPETVLSSQTNTDNQTVFTDGAGNPSSPGNEEPGYYGPPTPGTETTPLQIIGGVQVLKYPIDMDTRVQDYLQISVFTYKPANKIPTINEQVDTTRNLRQEKALEIIQIPVPNSVADQNTVEWGGGRMNSTAGQLGNAVTQPLQETDGGLKGGLEALAQTAFKIGESAVTAASNTFIRRRYIANQIAGAISSLTAINVDIDQAITRLGGVVENPNLELLFTGPALRTFSFTVRFTPRSDAEAARVRTIIRVLKQRSAVKKGVKFFEGEEGSNLLLGTPDVFKLQYKNSVGEIKGVNKIKTCALTSLSVDYTGGSGRWSTYEVDSQPVTTVIQMTFSELAPIYDTDYNSTEELPLPADDVGF